MGGWVGWLVGGLVGWSEERTVAKANPQKWQEKGPPPPPSGFLTPRPHDAIKWVWVKNLTTRVAQVLVLGSNHRGSHLTPRPRDTEIWPWVIPIPTKIGPKMGGAPTPIKAKKPQEEIRAVIRKGEAQAEAILRRAEPHSVGGSRVRRTRGPGTRGHRKKEKIIGIFWASF